MTILSGMIFLRKLKVYELRDYQKKSRINFFKMKRKLLHYSVSGGKTLTALDIIDSLMLLNEVDTVLVITPLTVGKEVWEQEIKKFGFNFTCTNLTKMSTQDGVNLVLEDFKTGNKKDITIINKDKLNRFLWGKKKKVDRRMVTVNKGVCNYATFTGYDMIVVDESTMFKRNSKRTTGFLKFLRHYNPKYRLLLTGTPWTTSGENIYWQYKLLFEGDPNLRFLLGSTLKEFRNNYYDYRIISTGKMSHRNKRVEYDLRAGAKEAMAFLMAPFTDVITIDDVRDAVSDDDKVGIQTPIITSKVLQLPPHLKKEYNRIKKEEVISISNELDVTISTDEELVFQMGNGNKGNKLRQLLSGFIYYNYDDAIANDIEMNEFTTANKKSTYIIKPILDLKLRALEDIIEEREGENIFVLFNFEAEREYLLSKFPHAVLLNSSTSNDVVPRWNRKEIKLMIANPMSVSHGLNLQYGGKTWVWYTPTYSLEAWLQTNGRLPRPNQQYQTEMIQIKFKGTVDETVYRTIDENTTLSDEWTVAMQAETKKEKNNLCYKDVCL